MREALRRLIHGPFRIETSESQIIFFDPEAEHPLEDVERATAEMASFRELAIPAA